LVRDLLEESGRALGIQNTPDGMLTLSTIQLEARHILHCLGKGMWQKCCMFHEGKAE